MLIMYKVLKILVVQLMIGLKKIPTSGNSYTEIEAEYVNKKLSSVHLFASCLTGTSKYKQRKGIYDINQTINLNGIFGSTKTPETLSYQT